LYEDRLTKHESTTQKHMKNGLYLNTVSYCRQISSERRRTSCNMQMKSTNHHKSQLKF